jgi:hypothetical protein
MLVAKQRLGRSAINAEGSKLLQLSARALAGSFAHGQTVEQPLHSSITGGHDPTSLDRVNSIFAYTWQL